MVDEVALGQALANQLVAAQAANPPPANRKVPTFEEAQEPSDWRLWRERFSTISEIARWNDLRRRRELYAAMKGAAARAVADIAIEDPAHPPAGHVPLTIDAVLTAYEARFVTVAASDAARAEFSTAVQLPAEPILEWHGRLRELFRRAYPAAEIDAGASGQLLRDRFIQGLDDAAVKEHVLDGRPGTYDECLTRAQNKAATLMIMNGGRTPKRTGLHAMGGGNRYSSASSQPSRGAPSMKCWFCGTEGHPMRECTAATTLAEAREFLSRKQGAATNAIGATSGARRNARRGNNNNNGNRKAAGGERGKKRINSMQEEGGGHQDTASGNE